MPSPYCPECGKTTGGCWQHNGTGIYRVMPDGSLLQTHAPAIRIEGGVSIYYLRPLFPELETSSTI